MTIMDHAAAPPPPPLKERLAPTFERLDRTLKPLGLGWVVPWRAFPSATGRSAGSRRSGTAC